MALMAALLWALAGGPAPIGPADVAGWYAGQTGYTAEATWFGAYALAPAGDQLYIGFGSARPAEFDGALVARWDGQTMTAVASLPEQGLSDMELSGGRLYIPGTDPLADWSLGNLYVYDGHALTQRRTLPHTIHAWDLWVEPDGTLLVAVGRHLGDQRTWAGGIYASTDDGQTWTLDADPALGRYRTYAVARGRGGLVAVASDGWDCQAVVRRDGGAWQRAGRVGCRGLAVVQGRVLAMAADGYGIVEPLTGRELRLDWQLETGYAYQWLATDGRTVYALAAGGAVRATDDLQSWRTVATCERPLLSLAWWPGQGLVVAERGAPGRVWLVGAQGLSV